MIHRKPSCSFWLMQVFWIAQLFVIVLMRVSFADGFSFVKAIGCWTAICAIGVFCHHFLVLKDKNWMGVSIAFFIPYWLVFYLIPLRISMDGSYTSTKEHIVEPRFWPDIVYVASLGIVCFMIGYSVFSHTLEAKKRSVPCEGTRHEKETIGIAAWGLLMIACAAFLLFMKSGGLNLYEGGYIHVGNLGWLPRATYIVFELTYRAAACAWAIYIIFCNGLRLRQVVPIAALLFMVLMMVLSGDRGLLAWTSICVLVVLSQKKPIRFQTLLLVILSASVLLAFVQIYRALEPKSIAGAVQAMQAADYWPLLGLTQFAEACAPTVTNAFAIVEEQGHRGGLFFSQDLLGIIPFYGKLFPWLPAAGDLTMHGTGAYVTYYVFGYHPYGLATTIVTDLYIDFPVPIVMILLLMYGAAAGVLYQKRFCGRFKTGLFCYATLFPGFMYSVRANYFSSIRLLWAIVIYVVVITLSNVLRRHSPEGA